MNSGLRCRAVIALPLLLLVSLLSTSTIAQALPEDLSTVRVTSSLRPELQISPGERRTHQLTLENTGAETVLVDVTKVDFQLDESGGLAYQPMGSQPASNASWIEVASRVEVPAATNISLPVAIQAPAGVEAGTYWSMLLVQPVDATRLDEDQSEDGVRTTVTVNFRFGVTVITHVGRPAEQHLLFRDPDLVQDQESGTSTVSVAIDNPTRFLASADVWLELYDVQGNMVLEVQGGTLRIYPTTSRRHTFDLGALEDQAYQAIVIADAGREAVFGVRYDLDLSAD